MRLGIDIRELARGRATGIGRFVRDFVRFASEARPDHRFFLYGNQHTQVPGVGPNVETRLVPERLTLWWDQRVLPRLAARDQLDVLLSPYVKGPLCCPCPLVITIHDLLFLVLPEGGWRGRLRNLFYRSMARQVARRAALAFADSHHSSLDAQRFLDLPADKIRVLPLALSEGYHPVRDPVQLGAVWQRYGVQPPYVFYLGHFRPHKNVELLLRAYAALDLSLRQGYQLVLGGRPDHWQARCQGLAQELGIDSRVRFTGMVAEEDMPALYSGAELFVFPSRYEGFGLPPLEAMACGTAVVAANRTSLPEVVGHAGVLVDPDDPGGLAAVIGRILGDEEERVRLEGAGLERAARFTPSLVYGRQLAILEELARR
ncbi:MAG: glycosyltransferase family 4 protein [Candidatus Latescibacteria bacterium]|nr:glycosyltransferase family 4 protein [Candidatus Latescibacterota bacterium]